MLNALTRPLRFGLALGLCAGPMLLATPAMAAQTLVVSAGAESPGGDVQLNAFAPNMITVNVGDTVTWHLDSTEFHNIYFPVGDDAARLHPARPGRRLHQSAGGYPLVAQTTTAARPRAAGCSTKATRAA